MWVAIGIGGIGLLIALVLWWGRESPAGKAYSPDPAMGIGMLDTHQQRGDPPVHDSGTGSAGTGSDGGTS